MWSHNAPSHGNVDLQNGHEDPGDFFDGDQDHFGRANDDPEDWYVGHTC
jgi:hypothetical protein